MICRHWSAKAVALGTLILLGAVLLAVAPSAARADGCGAPYSGGDGMTPATAYLISNQLDLIALSTDVTCDPGDYYRQTADIDISGIPWIPIGRFASGDSFSGNYDGGGHRITGLSMPGISSSETGLFGRVVESEIHNLTLVGPSLGDGPTGAGHIGALAGQVVSSQISRLDRIGAGHIGALAGQVVSSQISDVHVIDAVVVLSRDDYDVGALIGSLDTSSVANVSASGAVQAGSTIGGLVGDACGSNVSASAAAVSVQSASSGTNVGGLIGDVRPNCLGFTVASVCIVPCYTPSTVGIFDAQATGAVQGGTDVGGLVGRAYEVPVERSFATGIVSGVRAVGGLLGLGEYATIIDSYSRGAVTGEEIVGGLIGQTFEATLMRNFATGRVTAVTGGGGGLVGIDGEYMPVSTSATASYWDLATTGQATSQSGVGKTTAQLRTAATFSDSGWSIAAGRDLSKVWGICSGVNDGYPFLINTHVTAADPCPVAPVAAVDTPAAVAKAPVPVTLAVLSTAGQSMSIVTRLRVSGAGSISQVGTLGGSKVVVCRQTKRAMRAGTVVLVCAVNAATQALLRTQRVKVVVVTTFTSKSGTVVRRHRTVVLPRIVSKPIAVTG